MSWDDRIIGDEELSEYLDEDGGADLPELAMALIEHQREHWTQLAEGYAAFEEIETKRVMVEESEVVIQHNPGRIRSTAAATDKTSVSGRACFLCPENLPEDEKGIAYGDDLVILCNPFPVLDRHLSIVHREHVEQKIEGNVETLLALARDFGPEFFVLYNGPECGASAPDHLHFQACSRALLPIEEHLFEDEPSLAEDCSYCEETANNTFELFTLGGCGRSVVVFRGGTRGEVERWLYEVLEELGNQTDRDEPLVNIVCVYDSKLWTVYLFPRAKHRPASFFAEGDARLTISPGAIDMAGVVVVPERAHFDKIESEQITRIFAEVSLSSALVNDSIDGLCSLPGPEERGW
jgi:ATP adenylyltransferase/5',5'''-P-1,P-4-tetraphosphate phosphorylase II